MNKYNSFFCLEMGNTATKIKEDLMELGKDKINKKMLERELQRVFTEKTTIKQAMNAFEEIDNPKDAIDNVDATIEKLRNVLNLAEMILPSFPQVQVQMNLSFSILSTVLQKIGTAWKLSSNLSKNSKTYTELQRYEDFKLCQKACGLDDLLFLHITFLDCLDRGTDKTVINILQSQIRIDEITMYLAEVHCNVKNLIVKSDKMSACRATAYVDVYFRLAILRTLVLWQVFSIKMRSGLDSSSTKGVWKMIITNKATDLDLFRDITQVNPKKSMFLSVFHPTECENFLRFVQIHSKECNFSWLDEDKRFTEEEHYIVSAKLEGKMIKMPRKNQRCVLGSTENTDACIFKFEAVKGRERDNIFFLKSKHFGYYVYMYEGNQYCYSIKEKPGSEGQWKIVRFEEVEQSPQYIISSLKWPGLFLSLTRWGLLLYLKGTYCTKEVMEKGLWKIHGS